MLQSETAGKEWDFLRWVTCRGDEFNPSESDFTTGVTTSLQADVVLTFSLLRQPLVTDYRASCPNMVAEAFWRRCWQTSHCAAGQWHSLWVLPDTQSHRGCCSLVLDTRTRTWLTLLTVGRTNSYSQWGPSGFGHYVIIYSRLSDTMRAYIKCCRLS